MNQHQPVLLDAILENLKSWDFTPKTFLDGTFGRGGHMAAILQLYPDLKIVAMDQDPDAIKFGEERFAELIGKNLQFVHGNFAGVSDYKEQIYKFFGGEGIDLILLDLGVSSPQLDSPERGFSFYHD